MTTLSTVEAIEATDVMTPERDVAIRASIDRFKKDHRVGSLTDINPEAPHYEQAKRDAWDLCKLAGVPGIENLDSDGRPTSLARVVLMRYLNAIDEWVTLLRILRTTTEADKPAVAKSYPDFKAARSELWHAKEAIVEACWLGRLYHYRWLNHGAAHCMDWGAQGNYDFHQDLTEMVERFRRDAAKNNKSNANRKPPRKLNRAI